MEDTLMKKFYSISEVSKIVNLPISTIRYWEQKFTQLKPIKTKGGTRKYTQKDIATIKQIQLLSHKDGFALNTIKKKLNASENKQDQINKLYEIREFLNQLINNIHD